MTQSTLPPRHDSSRLQVLTTKLAIPPLRSDIIARPRLTERLDAALSGKLTLVSAPPGSGKTTLITEWLHSAGAVRSVTWLGLDPGDNDPGRFLTYLVAAIRTARPEFGRGLLSLLQTAISTDASLALVDLINALTDLPDQVVLVLDDYHVIDSDDVHRVVAYLLEHQPPTLHVIMTSRETPPLPLSNLRAHREMVEIRREDLRFTVEEATAFLNGAMGLDLTTDQVAALEERTEGWIAGLLLAALSARDAADPVAILDAFGGGHRYVFDYLAAEVLDRQPENVQRFLEQTSVLGRMSAELVEALTGGGQEMLDYLVEANLFTLPLDSQRTWYRYHHLFGDFLSSRFRESDPDGWLDAHRRAGDWFYRQGHRFEAAEHAFASSDVERLVDLVTELGSRLVRRGRISTVSRWLAALPDDVVRQHPALVLQQAWTAMFARDHDRAAVWLDRVDLDAEPDPEGRKVLRTEEAVCRATLARFVGNADEVIRLSSIALDLSRGAPSRTDPNGSVPMLHLGSALRIRGDTIAAVDALRRAHELSIEREDHIVEINAMSQLAGCYWDFGEYELAADLARQAMAHEDDYGLRSLAMSVAARSALGDILRQSGDLDEARRLIQSAFEIISVTRDGEDILAQMWTLQILALIEIASGAPEAARQAMDEAIERARFYRLSDHRQWLVKGLRASIDLLLGDREQAARWDPMIYPLPSREHPSLEERAAMAGAWILADRGQLTEASERLGRLIAELGEVQRLGRRAEARLLLAAVRDLEGQRDEAVDLASRAAEWAVGQRAWRVLVDTHPAVHALLPAVRERWMSGGREWPSELDAIADLETGQGWSGLVEPLTEREREVLELIGAGLTNRDVADRLFVSVGTIKRHTHNIYGKLGVDNRSRAVVRARELGLFGSGEERGV